MIFEDVEHEIKSGDLLLCRGRALHSRIIQRWTKSVYSHVGVAHWIRSGRMTSLDILEAKEGSGVQTWPVRKVLESGAVVDWFEIVDPNIDRELVVKWLWERRGHRYASPRQLIRSFVTIPLLEFLGLPSKIDGNRRFCSFIATEALIAGHWKPPAEEGITPELISPGGVSLFNCLRRRGTLQLKKHVTSAARSRAIVTP